MKIVLSIEEVRDMVRKVVGSSLPPICGVPQIAQVTFIHKYSDGSGETDIESLGSIDRVEVELGEAVRAEVNR